MTGRNAGPATQQETVVPPSVRRMIASGVRRARGRCTARVFLAGPLSYEMSDAQLYSLLVLEEQGRIEMAVL